MNITKIKLLSYIEWIVQSLLTCFSTSWRRRPSIGMSLLLRPHRRSASGFITLLHIISHGLWGAPGYGIHALELTKTAVVTSTNEVRVWLSWRLSWRSDCRASCKCKWGRDNESERFFFFPCANGSAFDSLFGTERKYWCWYWLHWNYRREPLHYKSVSRGNMWRGDWDLPLSNSFFQLD